MANGDRRPRGFRGEDFPELPGETPSAPRRPAAAEAGRTAARFLKDLGVTVGAPLLTPIEGLGGVAARGIETASEFGRGFAGLAEPPVVAPAATPSTAAQVTAAIPTTQRAADRGSTVAAVPRAVAPAAIPGVTRITGDTVGGVPLFTNIGVGGFEAVSPEIQAVRDADITEVQATSPLFAGQRAFEAALEARRSPVNEFAEGDVASGRRARRTPAEEIARAQGVAAQGITRQLRQPGGIRAATLPAILQGLAQVSEGQATAEPSLGEQTSLLQAQTSIARLGQEQEQFTQRAQAQAAADETKTIREIFRGSTDPTGVFDRQIFEENLQQAQQLGFISGGSRLTRQQAENQLTAAGTPAADIKKILDEQFPEVGTK